MDIRSTRHGCIVTLQNGLTLELCYDQRLSGSRRVGEDQEELEHRASGMFRATQGVWLFREEVVFEVQAGQA
jgi:hypothetical protein